MTEEQAAYLRSAVESIGDAEILLQNGGRPGRAASCAYYAMHYAAMALMLPSDQPPWRHKAVIAAFRRDFSETGKVPSHLHDYIALASEKRVGGDYDPAFDITRAEVEEQITHAREFVAECEGFLRKQP